MQNKTKMEIIKFTKKNALRFLIPLQEHAKRYTTTENVKCFASCSKTHFYRIHGNKQQRDT